MKWVYFVPFIDQETEALEVLHNLHREIRLFGRKSCDPTQSSDSGAMLFNFELFDLDFNSM